MSFDPSIERKAPHDKNCECPKCEEELLDRIVNKAMEEYEKQK